MDLSQWEMIEKNYDDLRFGPIDIYLNQQDGQQLLMVKNILCVDDEMFLTLHLAYQRLYRDKPRNVLNLQLIKADRETKVIILYFPYPNFDLYDRQEILQNPKEILKFLYDATNALSYYEKNQKTHFNIKPEYFYYDNDTQQYILLPSFDFKQSYEQNLQAQIDDNQIVFWSPEVFKKFTDKKININIHKQNLFSVGIIILSLLIETDIVQQVYDTTNFIFNKDLFNNIKLVVDNQNFKEKKYEFLSEVLFDNVLVLDPEKRETPSNCLKIIKDYQDETDFLDNQIESKFQSQKNLDKPKMIGSGTIQEEEQSRPKTQQQRRESRKTFQMSFGNLIPNNNLHFQGNQNDQKNDKITEKMSDMSPNYAKTDTQYDSQTIKQKTRENWPYQIDSKPDNASSQLSFDFENDTEKFSENQDFIDQMMEEHKSQGKTEWFEKSNENVDTSGRMQFDENIAKQINKDNTQQEDDDKELYETAGFEARQTKRQRNSESKVDETFDSIISSNQHENTIISINEDDVAEEQNTEVIDPQKVQNQFAKKISNQNIQVIEYQNQESDKNIVFDVTPDNEQVQQKQGQLFNVQSEELHYRQLQKKNYQDNFYSFCKELFTSTNQNSFSKFLLSNQKPIEENIIVWNKNQDKFKANIQSLIEQFEKEENFDIQEVQKQLQDNIIQICNLQPRNNYIELFFQKMFKFCTEKYIKVQKNFQSLNYSEHFDKKRQSVQNYYFMQSGYSSKFNSQRNLQNDDATQKSFFDNEKFTEINMKMRQSNDQLSLPKGSKKKADTYQTDEKDYQYQPLDDSKEELFYRSNQEIYKEENQNILNFAQKMKNSRKNLNQDPELKFQNVFENNNTFHSERQIKQEETLGTHPNQSDHFAKQKKQQNVQQKKQETKDSYEQELQDSFKQFEDLPVISNIKANIKPFQSEQKVLQENTEDKRDKNRTFNLNKSTNTEFYQQEQPVRDTFKEFVEYLNQSQFKFEFSQYQTRRDIDYDNFFIDLIDQLNQKKSQSFSTENYKKFIFQKKVSNTSQKSKLAKYVIVCSNNKLLQKRGEQSQIQQQKPLLQLQNIQKILLNENLQDEQHSDIDSKNQTLKIKFQPNFQGFLIVKRLSQKAKKDFQISQKHIFTQKFENLQKNVIEFEQKLYTQNDKKPNKLLNESKDSIKNEIEFKQERQMTPELVPKRFMFATQELNLNTQMSNLMYSQELVPQQTQSIQKISTILKNDYNQNEIQQHQRGQKRQVRLSTRSVDINLQKPEQNQYVGRQSQYIPREQARRFGSKSPVRIVKYTEKEFKTLNKEHQKEFKKSTHRPGVSVDRNRVYEQIQKINNVQRPQNSPIPIKSQPFNLSQHIETQIQTIQPKEQSFQNRTNIQQIQSEKFTNKKNYFFEHFQNSQLTQINKKQQRKLVSARTEIPLKDSSQTQLYDQRMPKRKNQRIVINIDKIQKDTYKNIAQDKDDETVSVISGIGD